MPPAAKLLQRLDPPDQVRMIRFAPDGKTLAAASTSASIRLYSLGGDKLAESAELKGHHQGWVEAVAFSPDNRALFAADSWGRLTAWNLAERKPAWSNAEAHDGWIHALCLHPSGKAVVTGGRDGTARSFDAATGKQLRVWKHPEPVFSVAFAPDGSGPFTGDFKGTVREWAGDGDQVLGTFDAAKSFVRERIQDVGGVRCLAFDAAGTTLYAGGIAPKGGGFVQGATLIFMFDRQTRAAKQTLTGASADEGFIYEIRPRADGGFMSVSSGQPGRGKFCVHDREGKIVFTKADAGNCWSLAVHPDGKRVALAGTNGDSAGNGRVKGKKEGEYPGNFSPISLMEFAG